MRQSIDNTIHRDPGGLLADERGRRRSQVTEEMGSVLAYVQTQADLAELRAAVPQYESDVEARKQGLTIARRALTRAENGLKAAKEALRKHREAWRKRRADLEANHPEWQAGHRSGRDQVALELAEQDATKALERAKLSLSQATNRNREATAHLRQLQRCIQVYGELERPPTPGLTTVLAYVGGQQ